MPTILDVNFGREFFGGLKAMEKQGRKIRYRNSPSKFAGKFAGDCPQIRQAKKNHPKSTLQNLGLKICLDKTRLLKHDLPVHGQTCGFCKISGPKRDSH